MISDKPIILRLNALTTPMSDVERRVLAPLDAEIVEIEGDTDEEILEKGAEADAIMVISAYLHGMVIRQLGKLKLISRLGTGVDKIDIKEATRQGVLVTNLPDFSTEEVADHTMALLLASARLIKRFDSFIRNGKRFDPALSPVAYTMHRLATQTLGIVGFGRIGKAVARRASGFGLRIFVHDPMLSTGQIAEYGVEAITWERILTESDYLCLLCPLTPTTRGMITMRELRKMKPSTILINTGRGELVDERDVAEALRTGVIRYVGNDVYGSIDIFAEGGFPTDHPYFSLENAILTPHVAAGSVESGIASSTDGAQAVLDVLSGEYPRFPVNPEVVPKIQLRRRDRDSSSL